jgi:lysophospholipase L1-like esterase
MIKKTLFSFAAVCLSITFALGMAEGIVRLKNASMDNYDIEMWKYSLKLKIPSDNPNIGHEHKPSQTAKLQSVTIRTNEYGLRGAPVLSSTPPRRILFLGSSVTLGWGVAEEQTVTQLLQHKLQNAGENVEVLNAGIGNINAPRYVERFITKLTPLKPTDIVVQYVMRDAEVLEAGRKSAILRHSQLATTMWIVSSRYFNKFKEPTLEEHYKKVYEPSNSGFIEMQNALAKLAIYCKENNIRLYLAMTPDLHNLTQYPYNDIHEKVKNISTSLGYTYIDLLPSLKGLLPEQVWAMRTDPHPNALGHERMAEAIFPNLLLNQST